MPPQAGMAARTDEGGEGAWRDLLGLREAMQWDDVARIHGMEIARPLLQSISEDGKRILYSRECRLGRRCRSDPFLDRTTSYLFDSLQAKRVFLFCYIYIYI